MAADRGGGAVSRRLFLDFRVPPARHRYRLGLHFIIPEFANQAKPHVVSGGDVGELAAARMQPVLPELLNPLLIGLGEFGLDVNEVQQGVKLSWQS